MMVIVPLKNVHDFPHSPLEEREILRTWPEESFFINNSRVNPPVLKERAFPS
jgi:hypothetical protein